MFSIHQFISDYFVKQQLIIVRKIIRSRCKYSIRTNHRWNGSIQFILAMTQFNWPSQVPELFLNLKLFYALNDINVQRHLQTKRNIRRMMFDSGRMTYIHTHTLTRVSDTTQRDGEKREQRRETTKTTISHSAHP